MPFLSEAQRAHPSATYVREPVIQNQYPERIVALLAESPAPVRVLNDYNISGYLVEFGGPNVRLAIDGRADRYGDAAIREYTTLYNGSRGWKPIFARYDPDAVVIEKSSALFELLRERGWRTVVVDGRHVMLEHPR